MEFLHYLTLIIFLLATHTLAQPPPASGGSPPASGGPGSPGGSGGQAPTTGGYPPSSGGLPPPPDDTIVVASSLAVAPILNLYSTVVDTDAKFTFTLANATTCKQAFLEGQVDFIITEAPLPSELHTVSTCNQAYDIYEIPIVHDGLAFIYKFNGSDDAPALVLDGETLVGIYTRNITRWNDPKLQALNKNITLPSENIIPYYIADSDLSIILDKALSSFSSNWNSAVENGWPAGVRAVPSSDGQGYQQMSSIVTSRSGIGFIPYSDSRKAQNRVANFYHTGSVMSVSDANILAAVSSDRSAILQDMQTVQSNNYPTNIPTDMWDITNNNSSTSWPFAYIVLLSIRLHSVPSLVKAESTDSLVKWLVGSSIAGTQFKNQFMIPLLAPLVEPASKLVDTMTVCQSINITTKNSVVGGGSDVLSGAIQVISGLFSSNPLYFYSVDYNDPNVITTNDALKQVQAGTLDFSASLAPLSGDSIHSAPLLGLAVALIANIPGSPQTIELQLEQIQQLFAGSQVVIASCATTAVFQAHPDLVSIFVSTLNALNQGTAPQLFTASTENDTVVAVKQNPCSVGLVSALTANLVGNPLSIVSYHGILPSFQAISQSFYAGTLTSPNITAGYPFVAYLFVSFKVTDNNCNSATGVADFIFWTATDASSSAAANTAYLVPTPFVSDLGNLLTAITCNGDSIITPFTSIQGEGSVFGGPIYMLLTNAYLQVDSTVRISFATTSSGAGLDDLIANNVLFAATDYKPSPAQSAQAKDFGLYATFAGSITLAYRIDTIPYNTLLNLTREAIVDIFLGEITNWNDISIQLLNPHVQLPNAEINLVYDSDPSGMSSVFAEALSSFSPKWKVQPSASVTWPVPGTSAAGSANVATEIASTNNALGYLGLIEGSSLPWVSIQNKAGKWVTPNYNTLQSAVNDSINNFDDSLYCSIVDMPGENSWPIATYTYTVLHQKSMKDYDSALGVLNFVLWSINNSFGLIARFSRGESYGYVGVPQEIFQKKLLPQLHQIRVNGKLIFPIPKDYRALRLGLGIGIILGIALIVALLILFCCWRRRQQQKTRIDPRTILSDIWDDLNDFRNEVLESTLDSPLVSGPALMSPPSTSITRLLKSGSTDPILALEANTDVAIGDGKQLFTFDLPPGSRCPVDKELTENIELTNNSSSSVTYKIFVPYSEHQFRIQITPGYGSIKKGETVMVEVRFTLLMTTNITRRVKFEFSGQSKHASASMVTFSLRGEVSTKLDPDDIDIIGKPIGKGAFGTVYKGSYRGSAVAIKVLRRQNDLRTDQLDDFLKEIELMGKLRSPYIVNLLGASYVPGKMCVLTEFMDKGSVSRLLKAGQLTDLLRLKIAKDTCRAMAFLHNNGVMHRDLKPANLLIVSLSKSAEISVKISDFGTSRSVQHIFQNERYTKGLGTPKYMAPELFTGSPYSGKVDTYAFAILVLELYIQRDPYGSLTKAWDIPDFVAQGNRPDIPATVPGIVAAIIQSCWEQVPEDRPDFNNLIEELEPLYEEEARKAQAMKAVKLAPDGAVSAELDNSEKDNGKESHSNTGGSTGLSMSGNLDMSGDPVRIQSTSNSNSNSNAPNPLTSSSSNSVVNTTITINPLDSSSTNSINNTSTTSNSGARPLTYSPSSGTITYSTLARRRLFRNSRSLPGTGKGDSGTFRSSVSTESVTTQSQPISRPNSVLIRNFKDEPRIGWSELHKQFEEGTDGVDMTNSMV